MTSDEDQEVADIVEAFKAWPTKPDRLVLRLLRHAELIVGLFTESDPLPAGHGPVEVTVMGRPVVGHRKIVDALLDVPAGQAIFVSIHPRTDLQRWATKADFVYVDPEALVALPTSSSFNLPAVSASSARLNRPHIDPRATPRMPPDPESAIG